MHKSHRAGWLRAGVLGANDGLVSTAALMVGVASADPSQGALVVTGIAAIAAGALSMGIGEYSSVSSQRDAELADLAKERHELAEVPEAERKELAAIYRGRGLSADLADQVATELMSNDALGAHARDELGLDPDALAKPVQAALVSSGSFTIGAALPVLTTLLLPASARVVVTFVATLVALGTLGAVGASLGGASMRRAATRVLVGGAAAMVITALIGRLTGAAV
jgi:vacuolar iron transporter family protein